MKSPYDVLLENWGWENLEDLDSADSGQGQSAAGFSKYSDEPSAASAAGLVKQQ